MSTVKHTAQPATAEQILSTIQITKEHREMVNWVLAELGYASDGQKKVVRRSSTGATGKREALAKPPQGTARAATKSATTARAAKKTASMKSAPRTASKY